MTSKDSNARKYSDTYGFVWIRVVGPECKREKEGDVYMKCLKKVLGVDVVNLD